MEVRCPKCYKPGIVNGIGLICPHGHPSHPEPYEEFPVGINSPKTGTFTQLKVDVCKHCGHVVRYYV